MKWRSGAQNDENPAEEVAAVNRQGRPRAWLFPLIGLLVIIVLAVAGAIYIKGLIDQPVGQVKSDNSSFEVAPAAPYSPDRTPPQISGINVSNKNFNTVEITWATDEPSTTQVYYHIAGGLPAESEKKLAMVYTHSVELTDLKDRTSYHYQVISVDQYENEAVSEEKTFDIGTTHGIPKVDVAWSTMNSLDSRTFIRGEIKNTGEVTLTLKEIEVTVTISVAGKPAATVVTASLDPYPFEIHPQELHKFAVEVPARTDPSYTINARVVQP